LLALGALAAGVVAGIAAEEIVYRRTFRARQPGEDDVFGSVRGNEIEVNSFDDTPIAVSTFGAANAPACVFLHGFTLTRDIWHYQLRDLQYGRLRLIAYDARGHGLSGRARGPGGETAYTATTLARDLGAVLDHLHVHDAVVVGHSMGGMAALAFAEEFPADVGARVRGLVLLNTTFTSSLGAWREDRPRFKAVRASLQGVMEWVARDPHRLDRLRMRANDLTMFATRVGFGSRPAPAHVAFTRRLIDTVHSETIAAAMVGLESYDTLHILEKIDVPVLVCAGEKDVITPAWLSREMAERIPDARLVIFADTGHMAMLERHAEFSERLCEFAEKILL
jgi:pimeloyl-ACP methyl ester carboxylesterase